MDIGQFEDLESIFNEKRKLVDALKPNGYAILNIDNPYLEGLYKEKKGSRTLTFGVNKDAKYQIGRIEQSIDGIKFSLRHDGKKYEVSSGVLGEHQAYVLTPALICADLMGMDMSLALSAIEKYVLPPGRLTVIPAINDAILLDSSYNSSPAALKESLKVLTAVAEGGHRRVAVLGDMNELGSQSRVLHEMIGEIIPKHVDLLLTVGSNAKIFAEKALEGKMSQDCVHSFKTSLEASAYFSKHIKKGDVILVKGSQNNVRLERFVKEFMANPEEAPNLLVRQEKFWKSKL
jgi:UDP-N-acetylmuramoyl-tripeptide--D-alanyl-D-alanine ligase